jgi:hypothetical protein
MFIPPSAEASAKAEDPRPKTLAFSLDLDR